MSIPAPAPLASERTESGSRARFRALAGAFIQRARELCPLTLRGMTVAGLALGALLFYGFGALDGVWYVAGIGLLGLCALALAAMLIAAGIVKLRLVRRPSAELVHSQTETGREVASGFALPGLRALVLVELDVQARTRAARLSLRREQGALVEYVRFDDHGEPRSLDRTLIIRDVFGLTSLGLRSTQALDLDVLPHAGALRSLPLLRSLSGGDDIPHPLGLDQGDRLELRRYAPGDPARFIHWKVYARTQKLVVRMPERALSRAQRVAAYLVAGPRDDASAAAARIALEEGALGADFRFAADGTPTPVRELGAALVAIRRSSSVRARPGAGLDLFAQEVDREGPSSLVLFVPAQLGPHVEAIGSFLRKRGRTARVVIGVDGVAHQRTNVWSKLERFALEKRRSVRLSSELLRELMASYRRHGCEVVVVDRESGRVLGDAHLMRPEQRNEEVAA
jgi:uncharacterized protein (DUF58 family)